MRQIDKLEAATKAAHTYTQAHKHTHTHKARGIKTCRANENLKQGNMPRKTTNKIAALVGLRLCSMLLTLSKVVGNLKKKKQEREKENRTTHTDKHTHIYILYI